ncbi:hypothetical protein BCR42DRAFT_423870 [Absidia repens]|uniref:Uncharacterized protein n=1 Tax=Absidia repens TaxID=90262 RepID=A0A1X2I4C4_9FUNG|nr:hypothetical protein BCR42DRAFT_423870 [Absidia repens]
MKLTAHHNQTLNYSLSVATVRQKLQAYLGRFFKCYVHGMAKLDQYTVWYKIWMFEDQVGTLQHQSAIVVHFYNTEYFLVSCQSKVKISYLEQAIVATFGAGGLKKQSLTNGTLEELSTIIENRKSLGVFNQFRYMKHDPIQNPLNFGRLSSATTTSSSKNESNDDESARDSITADGDNNEQQSMITSMSQLAQIHQNQYTKFAFITTKEERRRIIPIQADKVNQRYDSVEQVFGNYPLEGLGLLNIKLQQPVTPVLLDHGIQIQDEKRGKKPAEIKHDKHDDLMTKFFRDEDDEEMNQSFQTDGDSMEHKHGDGSGNESDDSEDNDLKLNPTTDETSDDLYSLTMGIKCTGTNVMAGLRDLALHGFMDPPYPPWMTDLVASGASRVFITETKMRLDAVV